VPPKDAHEEQWEGARTGPEGAVKVFGADEAFPNTLLQEHLERIIDIKGEGKLFVELPPKASGSEWSEPYPPASLSSAALAELGIPKRGKVSTTLGKFLSGSSSSTSQKIPPHLVLHQLLASNPKCKPLAPEVEELRMIKSPAELALMKRAGDISSEAHTRVMRSTARGMTEERKEVTEYMVQAEFEYHCAMRGSERPAYVPVVASG
jgi:intermediate cleaving peptidase 55